MVAKQIHIVSKSAVMAVAIADESQVVAGYENGGVRRWSIEDGQQQGPTMKAGDTIYSIAVSQDGRWIVSGDIGKKATVWNAATHKKVLHVEHNDWVYAVDISGDCTKVVSANYGTASNVRLSGISSGTQLLPPLSHSKVDGVKFSPDGTRFATASYDCGVRVYSTRNGKVLFDSGTQGSTKSFTVTPLAWSFDGQQLFVASKGKITCFNVSNTSYSEWSIHETQSRVSMASNGRFIACSAGSSVSLWDGVSHKQIGNIITHTAEISCIALSPSGGFLACGVGKSITIHNLRDVLSLEYFGSDPHAIRLPLIRVSVETLKSWTQGDLTNTETLLSEEIKSTSRPSHHLLANHALIRAHLKQVAFAMEDAEESLRVRPSPIGYIAMSVALLGRGDREGALHIFDLAFHDCELDENRLLLLLKSILAFESGNQEDAITRVEHLATRANNDGATYLFTQVLAVMYMKKGNHGCATQLIERAKNLAPKDKQCLPLTTITLIFGWSFNGLDIVPQQRAGIGQLLKNYIPLSQTIAVIDSIARKILKNCPLIVIDVATGCLCDGPERMRIFKTDPLFKELVSSTTTELDKELILKVVTSFFGCVMFSHAWQGNEPSFQEVNVVKSVWNLPETPLNEKLRNFCKETRRLGYKWAWSDTCCIDKTSNAILNQSLTSMYKWYADSAVTLVFLAGVAQPSKPSDLTRSFWMTRAWTLQELLAPKVVRFYDSEWKPFLNDTGKNHKKSPDIMQELASAIRIPPGTISTFTPEDLGVRDKLRLASTRNATVEEDVAYSLIGIFKSDIRPHYGEGADALGHLLEEIVARFGEVTVLAWSGKSSSYNSCLPASISVYNQFPYNPPLLEGEEMDTCIMELRGKLSQEVALGIYKQINSLPPARFAARRLHLPCIVFSVRRLGIQEIHDNHEKIYRARVMGLGTVEFLTADDLPVQNPQKLVLVHPWIAYVRGPSDGDAWGGDLESFVDFGLDSECGAGSGEVVPLSPLQAVPTPQVDKYTRTQQMLARLGQPFNALLLVQQPDRHYKRVATENEIVVPGLGTEVSSQNIQTAVLEIL